MDSRLILAISWQWASGLLANSKLRDRYWFPLGPPQKWLDSDSEVLATFRGPDGQLHLDPEATIAEYKDACYLKSRPLVESLLAAPAGMSEVYLVVEGSKASYRIAVQMDDGGLLRQIEEEDPSLRLHTYDLPPASVTAVQTARVGRAIYVALRERDSELHSRRTDDFVHSPHILLALLSQVMELRSKDQIEYVANLRCISDHLRNLLGDRILKLERNHRKVWRRWSGSQVSFADGGMARVTGLPGSEPLAIRVGVYTVVPGKSDPDLRESWRLDPYVAGDIIGAPADPDAEAPPPPDRKRLQEAARYILEALTTLQHARKDSPDILFLHGPLVNSFEMYDEGEPNFIPSLDKGFLSQFDIGEADVTAELEGIPPLRGGGLMWNHCMAIYGYLMKRLFKLETPVVGVVERSGSMRFGRMVLEHLVERGSVTQSYMRKLLERLDKYRITDEMLFGCVLDEGEYIEPLPFTKNQVRRAREHWQPVVRQYPHPVATYIKTSASNFPYRVEINQTVATAAIRDVMDLLYHTSLLLPEYSFPVGLDIVDKYSKVPDWLSRGVSAAIAAQVLAKAVATGEPRILQQVRRLLAQSPRDFFFRPHS